MSPLSLFILPYLCWYDCYKRLSPPLPPDMGLLAKSLLAFLFPRALARRSKLFWVFGFALLYLCLLAILICRSLWCPVWNIREIKRKARQLTTVSFFKFWGPHAVHLLLSAFQSPWMIVCWIISRLFRCV